MRIFITGASGFVGGAAINYFVDQGHTVYGMSRTANTDDSIRSRGAIPVRCDLLTIKVDNISGCDVLIHAAAYLGQWGDYQNYYEVNVAGTEHLLRIAREAGMKKFIYISTESVLVTGQNLVNVNETYPYPGTPYYYSKTKQLAEKSVRSANIPGIFDTICLRPRMIWGPGDRILLPLLKEAILSHTFSWIGGGHYRISTTHIDNLMSAINLSVQKATGGSVYFVADGQISTIRSFITRLLQTQGITAPGKSLPKWLVRTAAILIESCWRLFRTHRRPPLTRLGATVFSSQCTLDTTNIRKELGYRPVVSVEEGMQQLTVLKKRNITTDR